MDNTICTSAEASRESLWTVLADKKYNICIPRIQRDYAQGREYPEINQIRQIFLNDVFNALDTGETLDINFIYGNVEKDKRGITRFIPVDGQQRLTTLFLLYWYFAAWSGKLNEDNRLVLNRFRYETRFTTEDFCSRLVNDVKIDLKKLIESDKDIIDIIKDYYWFFSTYEHDATVKSMLVMLREIHNVVKSYKDKSKVDDYFDKLSSEKCPISFLFLNLSDIGLTDEIYIKMNARGKALTRFENFKAQLSAYLSEIDQDFSRKFIRNINGRWSQFFWHEEYRPDVETSDGKSLRKSNIFDDQILYLFRFVMMNEYIRNAKIDDGSTETKYLVRNVLSSLSRESDFQFFNHLFLDEFRDVSHFKSEMPNVDIRVFHFLDTLLNVMAKRKEDTNSICFVDNTLYDKEYINEENFFKRLIRASNEKPLSYEEQILFYAEMCFLVKYANEDYSFDKTAQLTDWVRYIYNLTRNTLYNAYDDYARSIRRVRLILEEEYGENILEYAARILRKNYKQGSGFGFVENQVMEESIKANLLLRDSQWKELVIKAENSFLGSQINAILSFSGIWNIYENRIVEYELAHPDNNFIEDYNQLLAELDDSNIYIKQFALYLEKFNLIFEKDAIKPEFENKSLLRRALLTFGGADSYMLPAGKAVCCFLDATGREESFKRLFRGDSPKNRQYFKEFLDSISVDTNPVDQLEKIIKEAKFDSESEWKRYFVEMPEILDSMFRNVDKVDPSGRFVFKKEKRYICKRSKNQIMLLEKTKTSSINREYYSYVLFLKACQKGLKVGYYTTFSENAEKYLTYKNKKNNDIQVLYSLNEDSKEYEYLARENNLVVYYGDINQMLDYIEKTIS